ncbi:hypothetical protein SCHPADRAFT_743480 [Schizopora paradoxa]|uniref:Uncharacterized protein n=1 Tax=Schizopora paradoxa TaxID=27342 RepID=A0A0H2QZ56_9AGAM|nr:hypothetical protein SCHPADRAFT_743480 [Schizopora paradoxa]
MSCSSFVFDVLGTRQLPQRYHSQRQRARTVRGVSLTTTFNSSSRARHFETAPPARAGHVGDGVGAYDRRRRESYASTSQSARWFREQQQRARTVAVDDDKSFPSLHPTPPSAHTPDHLISPSAAVAKNAHNPLSSSANRRRNVQSATYSTKAGGRYPTLGTWSARTSSTRRNEKDVPTRPARLPRNANSPAHTTAMTSSKNAALCNASRSSV